MVDLVACGDIFLGAGGYDGYPFAGVEGLLGTADISFANLEVVLSDRGEPVPKRVRLRSRPSDAALLAHAGFDVVSVANNHSGDYGPVALGDTLAALAEYGIHAVGAGPDLVSVREPAEFRFGGLSVGVLAYGHSALVATDDAPGCAPVDVGRIVRDVDELKQRVDIVVVSLHFGTEYVPYASPQQQQVARRVVDAGADVVLGHHPHVVQGIEIYRNAVIAYSLGNCQFGVAQDAEYEGADWGIALRISMSHNGVTLDDIVPFTIQEPGYCPCLCRGPLRDFYLAYVKQVSECLRPEISHRWWYQQASRTYISSQMDSFRVRIGRYGLVSQIRPIARFLVSKKTMRMMWAYATRPRRALDAGNSIGDMSRGSPSERRVNAKW